MPDGLQVESFFFFSMYPFISTPRPYYSFFFPFQKQIH